MSSFPNAPARDLLAVLKAQVFHTISLVQSPLLSTEELLEFANKDSLLYPGEPRWHDFLEPTLRDVVCRLEEEVEVPSEGEAP